MDEVNRLIDWLMDLLLDWLVDLLIYQVSSMYYGQNASPLRPKKNGKKNLKIDVTGGFTVKYPLYQAVIIDGTSHEISHIKQTPSIELNLNSIHFVMFFLWWVSSVAN